MTLLSRPLEPEERLVEFLLGSDALDARLRGLARVVQPFAELSELLLSPDTRRRLEAVLERACESCAALLLHLQGQSGPDRRAVAEASCHHLNLRLVVIDGERLQSSNTLSLDETLRSLARESRLQPAALYLDNSEALSLASRERVVDSLLASLEGERAVVMVGSRTSWQPSSLPIGDHFSTIEVTPPNYGQRQTLWRRYLAASTGANSTELDAVAGKFQLSAGQIRDAAAVAHNLAWERGASDAQPDAADLHLACRLRSHRTLASLAQHIEPRHTWADMVLPQRALEQLREIIARVAHRPRVFDSWGFEHKLSFGAGVSALFFGPSGTGKTMAAEVIAAELAVELYRIDLSTIVDKYIGETEKRLARLFSEASSSAILFFDEADALFGKRSEVKDAHDRYANIQVAYLLQEIERYPGIVILATNLRRNIDEAFVRRMAFTVSFPLPEYEQRLSIWHTIWPAETPLGAGLDFELLARRFPFTGGNIKNAALHAAFVAAATDSPVDMRCLISGIRREVEKIGRVWTDHDLEAHALLPDGQERVPA